LRQVKLTSKIRRSKQKGRLPGPSLLNNPALRRPARRELQQLDCVLALHAPPTRLLVVSSGQRPPLLWLEVDQGISSHLLDYEKI
jgi:hypothetical protein